MIKRFLKKYCGVVLFYLAVVGVAYTLCSSSNNISIGNYSNNMTISVNK